MKQTRRQIHYNTKTHRLRVDSVFSDFGNFQGRSLTSLARSYNYPKSTVCDWYNHYQDNPGWRPYDGNNHGLPNRIFTDEEENAIAGFITDTYINQSMLFTDQDCNDRIFRKTSK